MNCASCGHENPERAKFCLECGAAIAARCARCATELPPAAKFCLECGAATAVRAVESTGRRKVVTIVFADLVGSTALHERLDAESARRFMESYYRAMRGAVEAHGGTVTQLLGDGVKAVFGIPRVAEDDAIRAVRAAVEMQAAFHTLAVERSDAVGKTGLRVAVNTGEVVANDEAEIIGDPVNVAARLQEQGRDGDVVVGEATHRLVAERLTLELLGSFALKGRTEAVRAYRVVSLERPAGAATVAFVGRDEELARLTTVYETAIEKPAACLAVLLGSPGLGKSRLIEEFVRRRADEAAVLFAHCDAASGASFAPLAVALRQSLGVEASASGDALRASVEAALPGADADRARIVGGISALLAGSPASPEETFFVVRRLLASLAATKPVVLVIDDLHWAEPLLLDLVEHLAQWGSGVPLLVLVSARPELRDVRSSLATPGGLVADVLTLAGLDAGAAMRLAANVIGAADLPAAVAVKVLAASEGNPLFVGELVRMLVHEGALKKEGDRWTTGTALAALEMPPTIQALLASRIERLRPEERSVLERAAVVGRHFSRSAVAELLPRDVTDLDARLESLRRAELIERDTGWFLGEPLLRFHHVLIRDAAYRRVLKETRAELHARLADWIEAHAGEATEQDETIGWHLEQAHQHLRELGPIDAQGRALGERASRRLAAAGRRALARDDLPLAASLLGRALDRLDPADSARADLALDWCEALLAGGDVAPAAAAIDELGRFSASSARLRAWHTCFAGQLRVLTAPEGLHETADAVAAAATELTSLGDVAGEAKAHFVHALALARLGKVGACEAALDRALAAARRVDDPRRANTVLAIAPLAALWGPSPVTRASGRCLDVVRVLRIRQSAPAVEAAALSCQGVLEALRGRTDAARRMIASSRKMVEELGITQRLLETDVFAGQVELLEGDASAAERCLRPAFEGLRELGLGIDAARAAALLARALLAQGLAPEAEALSHESEALAGDDLKAAIAWRGVRAEALARRGEHEAAVELATKAVEIAAATDALLDHADARLALAAALRAAGRSREADAEERRAIELWEAKGATVLVERARHQLGRVVEQPEQAAPARLARRVRPNAATAQAARLDAAIAAQDADLLPTLYADGSETVDHTTGTTWDRHGELSSLLSLLRAQGPGCRHEALATLGDSLALYRRSMSGTGYVGRTFDVGAYEREDLILIEVDSQGRQRRGEVFAPDHLVDAVARLYERYAELLPDAAERERAAATARSVTALLGRPDGWPFAPDAEATDHRTVGFGSLRGADAVMLAIRSLVELTDDWAFRMDDVVDLRADALFVRWTTSGTVRASGGAFERLGQMFWVFGVDGRVARWEQLDAGQDAEARARFDELVGDGAWHFENAATLVQERGAVLWATHDLEAFKALHAPELRFCNRRRLALVELDRDGYFEYLRSVGEMTTNVSDLQMLATRGKRIALAQLHLEVAGGDVGPSEIEMLHLVETNLRGEFAAISRYDIDDSDAAYTELDARYEAGEGAEHPHVSAAMRALHRAFAIRNWEAFEALYAPDFVFYDHRLLGFGECRGAKAYAQLLQSLLDLAPDASFRADHVRRSDRGVLSGTTRLGTRDDGDFEVPQIEVRELDEHGKFRRLDAYDPEQLDQALARFEAIAAVTAPLEPAFSNVAKRALDRMMAAWSSRDWEGYARLLPAAYRTSDRRRMVLLELDREQSIEHTRQLGDMVSTRIRTELLATREDRLSLCRMQLEVAGDAVGPSEFESLFLLETNARGEPVASVRFDGDDVVAAYAELDARFAAGEAALHPRAAAWVAEFRRAFAARDWDAMSALCTPDQLAQNHRLVGWGTLPGPAAWIPPLQALVELAPDTWLRIDHLRTSDFGHLWTSVWHGTRDGGAYETPWIHVVELDERGLEIRLDVYDIEMLGAARARFDEIRARTASKAVERFANTATRAWREDLATFESRDWQRYRAIMSERFRFLDRNRVAQLELDRDQHLEYVRALGEMSSVRVASRVLATRGERLALAHLREEVAGGDVGPSEIDSLFVIETNDRGDVDLYVRFDADDVDAAYAELDARYEAGEAALHARVSATMHAFGSGWAQRDWEALTAQCASDIVFQDHRLLGFGTLLGGPADWIRTQRALVELAPDARHRLHHVRLCDRGYLCELAIYGTRDGGAFELPQIAVREMDGLGRMKRVDVFDPDQLDQALARFAEIGSLAAPDGLRIPPNAATRAWDRADSYIEAENWEALHALCDSITYEDRRPLFRITGDCEVFVANCRHISSLRARSLRSPLACLGDRLTLQRQLWRLTEDGQDSEVDTIALIEVDAGGRMTALIAFGPEDRAAAGAELFERYVASGGDGMPAARIEFLRSWNDHDLERMRALLPEDYFFLDHRRTGIGRVLGADAYIASLAALFELSRNVRLDLLYFVAAAPHGRVDVQHWFGTNTEGGEFEAIFVALSLYRGERHIGVEQFELEDLDTALARFEALRAEPAASA